MNKTEYRRKTREVSYSRTWTRAEDDFLTHWYGVLPDADIAATLGRKVGVVSSRAKWLRLDRGEGRARVLGECA